LEDRRHKRCKDVTQLEIDFASSSAQGCPIPIACQVSAFLDSGVGGDVPMRDGTGHLA
jgi:hypothetical protein